MVYNGKDRIVSVASWDSHYQIHCHLLEWTSVVGDADTKKGYFWAMCVYLVLLAGGAPLDVVHDPGIHAWPYISCSSSPYRLITSGVSCCQVIVGPEHYASF